jgi:zinc transport system substrate-binding protein
MKKIIVTIMMIGMLTLAACGPQPAPANGTQASSLDIKVLAANSFLADIAQNVAGERLSVESLIPIGLDPHAFEPTPQDVAKIADSQALIINGAGFEEWIEKTIENAGGNAKIIDASAGLSMREPSEDEPQHAHDHDEHEHDDEHEEEHEHDDHSVESHMRAWFASSSMNKKPRNKPRRVPIPAAQPRSGTTTRNMKEKSTTMDARPSI